MENQLFIFVIWYDNTQLDKKNQTEDQTEHFIIFINIEITMCIDKLFSFFMLLSLG